MRTLRFSVWCYAQATLACNRWSRRESGSGEGPSGRSRMLPPMGWRATGCRLPLAGAGVAGAVAGHTLAYALYVPDPGTRPVVLASSGHTYWSAAVAAAMVLGLASIGATVSSHFRAGLEPGRLRADEPFARLAVRLALLQMTIYLVQEALERLAVGVPLNDAIDHRLLLRCGRPDPGRGRHGGADGLGRTGRRGSRAGLAPSAPHPLGVGARAAAAGRQAPTSPAAGPGLGGRAQRLGRPSSDRPPRPVRLAGADVVGG